MSLEVASTTLDLTWSEFGPVAFTAGSLTDEDACVTEVESKLRRGTLGTSTTPTNAEVKIWLQRAKQELAEIRQFSWKRRYVTATLTAGTYRYALPPDFQGEKSLRDTTYNRKISIVSSHQFDILFPDPSEVQNGQMKLATIKNNELWVMPAPGGSDIVELEYNRSGDDITASDFSWLPEIERFRCCDFATAEAFTSIQDYERAQFFYARWERGLSKAVRSDGKKRWAAIGFRARSVFQA